jgi:2-keto-4-pentenoate hydratase/2-oxohepta-3-ene-1,7-dioic acid hydratase in catechol pathway
VDALPGETDLLALLPHGAHESLARKVFSFLEDNPGARKTLQCSTDAVRLLRPLESPGKILLLAGNYAAHIMEGGEQAVARERTFPYVFMKPPTTFNHPEAPIPIPSVSPSHIDYECELGVVIGKKAKHVREEDALSYVAGYTVVNDISDRAYKPCPQRETRPKDNFFDWLHGKWHDGFCPVGPCIASSRSIPDPQCLTLVQRVNGEVRQNASTANMIFPVAALIAFITQSVTLLPGDIIATGTPEGIAMTTGRYLCAGDQLEASVSSIGVLRNTMANES